MLNNRVPPNSHLRTRASIGAFLNRAVNRLEIEDTPDELLSSRLADKSQRALVATMGCKKRNYFHLKNPSKQPHRRYGLFPKPQKVFRTEVARVCGCIGVTRGVVKGGLGGFCPVGRAGFRDSGFGRSWCFFMDALSLGSDLSPSPSPSLFMPEVTKGVVVEIKTISMKTCDFQANIPGGFHGSTMVKRNNATWHEALPKKKKPQKRGKQKSLC